MTQAQNRELRRFQKHGLQGPARGPHVDRDSLLSSLGAFATRIERPEIVGFKSPEQELAVWKVLAGEDVLVVMPTGSGKSLVYQLPAFVRRDRLTLVISPLRALIKQQDELLDFGIGLHSETDDRDEVWRSLSERRDRVLLVSPEMLASHAFRSRMARRCRAGDLRLGLFVVDEVHCLSDWGHDFRAHYWWVAHHLKSLENAVRCVRHPVPRLLLTATADRQVRRDIQRHFPEIAGNVVKATAARPELILSARRVRSANDRLRVVVRFLERQARRELPPGVQRRGVVFTLEALSNGDLKERSTRLERDRLKADDVVAHLKRNGVRKTWAFASKRMSMQERHEALQAFENATPRKGQTTVIVATNAFGMGMDFPRVPFVCHLYPRPNLLEYWQQVGRAGRGFSYPDEWAETLALFRRNDANYALRFARPPATDGLLNAFTIPLHGWMYVWPGPGAEMSLKGPAGRTTRFGELLKQLQALGVVGGTPARALSPRGVLRYTVDLDHLRKRSTQGRLQRLQDGPFKRSRRLRKVFRYLRIAARSRKREYILLDQRLYSDDRQGTVLARLNRWVDAGYLVLDSRSGRAGVLLLRPTRKRLTQPMIQAIVRTARTWAAHKANGAESSLEVLRSRSPAARKRQMLKHLGETKVDRASVRIPDAVPAWLRSVT